MALCQEWFVESQWSSVINSRIHLNTAGGLDPRCKWNNVRNSLATIAEAHGHSTFVANPSKTTPGSIWIDL